MGIKISGLALVTGKEVVGNEKYVEHFRSIGQDVEHFMKDVLHLDKRFILSENETGLDLMKEAADKVLKETGTSAKDIDLLICCSSVPEYFSPTQALLIHRYIQGKSECISFDMNANCTSLLMAINNAKLMMANGEIKKALLVGCDIGNLFVDYSNASMYGHFGDCATALILENDIDSISGIIASNATTITTVPSGTCSPINGMKALCNSTITPSKDVLVNWNPLGSQESSAVAMDELEKLLDENNISSEDVALFCTSQVGYNLNCALREKFNLTEEKCPYYADKYGYTGCSSPFTVLHEAIKAGKVKHGDLIVLWTYGIGYSQSGIILRY